MLCTCCVHTPHLTTPQQGGGTCCLPVDVWAHYPPCGALRLREPITCICHTHLPMPPAHCLPPHLVRTHVHHPQIPLGVNSQHVGKREQAPAQLAQHLPCTTAHMPMLTRTHTGMYSRACMCIPDNEMLSLC